MFGIDQNGGSFGTIVALVEICFAPAPGLNTAQVIGAYGGYPVGGWKLLTTYERSVGNSIQLCATTQPNTESLRRASVDGGGALAAFPKCRSRPPSTSVCPETRIGAFSVVTEFVFLADCCDCAMRAGAHAHLTSRALCHIFDSGVLVRKEINFAQHIGWTSLNARPASLTPGGIDADKIRFLAARRPFHYRVSLSGSWLIALMSHVCWCDLRPLYTSSMENLWRPFEKPVD